MNRDQLKSQALSDALADQARKYEGRIADLRVELTMVSQELTNAKQEVERLMSELKAFEAKQREKDVE